MDFLNKIVGSFINKEEIAQQVIDAIQSKLASEAKIHGCTHKEIVFTFIPKDDQFNFGLYVYKNIAGQPPKFIRQIEVEEIVKDFSTTDE